MRESDLIKVLSKCDLNGMKKLLNLNNLGVLEYLLDMIVDKTMNKERNITIINKLISFCYIVIHDDKEKYNEKYRVILRTMNILKTHLLTCEKKSEQSLKISNVYASIESLSMLVLNISKNKDTECELKFLWYLITDIKSIHYVTSLITKNPSILKLRLNDESILEMFIKYRLNNINDNDPYYNKVLYLILECEYLNINKNDLNTIRDILDKFDSKNSNYNKLLKVFNNYFPNNDVRNTTLFNILKEKSEFVYRKPKSSGTRLDLRNTFTFSIDNCMNPNNINQDDAFSVMKDGNNYVMYIHITDVASYLMNNADFDEQIKEKLFTYKIFNCIQLFDRGFARKYLSLSKGVNRYALSLMVVISPNGEILDNQFYETIVNNDETYSINSINRSLKQKKHEIILLKEIAELLKGKDVNNNDLIDMFNKYINEYLGKYMYFNKLPIIYRNSFKIKKYLMAGETEKIHNYVNDSLKDNYLNYFVKFREHTDCSFYDVINYGNCGLEAYAQVSKPLRSYIDITNQKCIKEFIIKNNKSWEAIDKYYLELEDLANRANAVEAVLKLK